MPRTQQIVAYETGMTETVDPLAGSYFVESLTNEVEAAAWRYIEKIDDLGGAVAALQAGYMQDEIERAGCLFEWAKAVDDGEKVIVGLNKFADPDPVEPEVFPIDPELERQQAKRLKDLRQARPGRGRPALGRRAHRAKGTQNLLYPMKEALRAYATLGEVSDVLREEFGVYQPARWADAAAQSVMRAPGSAAARRRIRGRDQHEV